MDTSSNTNTFVSFDEIHCDQEVVKFNGGNELNEMYKKIMRDIEEEKIIKKIGFDPKIIANNRQTIKQLAKYNKDKYLHIIVQSNLPNSENEIDLIYNSVQRTELINIIILYDNINFLIMLNDKYNFIKTYGEILMLQCAHCNAVKCVNYILNVFDHSIKILIVDDGIINKRIKNTNKILKKDFIFEMMCIASMHGHVKFLKEFIIDKDSIKEELNNYDDAINLYKKDYLLKKINKNVIEEKYYNYEEDFTKNKIYYHEFAQIILNCIITKKMSHLGNYYAKFNEINNLKKKSVSYNTIPRYENGNNYLECIKFYEKNIRTIDNYYIKCIESNISDNTLCSNYLYEKINKNELNENEIKFIEEIFNKNKIILETEKSIIDQHELIVQESSKIDNEILNYISLKRKLIGPTKTYENKKRKL